MNHNAAQHHPETCGGLDNQCCECVRESLAAQLASTTKRAEDLNDALKKIDAIRNSIVGRQNINWSMHIYPLVAALDEAGFGGEGYDVARPKAEAEQAAYRAALDAAEAKLATAVEGLRDIEQWTSVRPEERDVWNRATKALRALGIDPSKEQGK